MINWDNFQSKLKDRGSKSKLSQETGISTGNISDWFNPNKKAQPNADNLVKISKALNCSVDYLLGLTDIETLPTNSSDIIPIPILKQRAAAGLGKESNDINDIPFNLLWFDREQIPIGAEYGIIIEGDSMEDKFHDGQVVFVKLVGDCNDGDYGIFSITENDETKIFFKQKKMLLNNTYVLHSINYKKYDDITDFHNKICRCIAVVVT